MHHSWIGSPVGSYPFATLSKIESATECDDAPQSLQPGILQRNQLMLLAVMEVCTPYTAHQLTPSIFSSSCTASLFKTILAQIVGKPSGVLCLSKMQPMYLLNTPQHVLSGLIVPNVRPAARYGTLWEHSFGILRTKNMYCPDSDSNVAIQVCHTRRRGCSQDTSKHVLDERDCQKTTSSSSQTPTTSVTSWPPGQQCAFMLQLSEHSTNACLIASSSQYQHPMNNHTRLHTTALIWLFQGTACCLALFL